MYPIAQILETSVSHTLQVIPNNSVKPLYVKFEMVQPLPEPMR